MYFEHLNQEEAVGLANYLRISIWNFNLGWAINNFRCYGFPGGGGRSSGGSFPPTRQHPCPATPYFKLLFPLFTLHGAISLLTPDE